MRFAVGKKANSIDFHPCTILKKVDTQADKVQRNNDFAQSKKKTTLRLIPALRQMRLVTMLLRDEATRDFEHARRRNFGMQIIARCNDAGRRCSLKSYNCISRLISPRGANSV